MTAPTRRKYRKQVRQTLSAQAVIASARGGYYVDDEGGAHGPHGPLKCGLNGSGYYRFNYRFAGLARPVLVHMLSAYLKYGPPALYEGVQVRHLDGNRGNNRNDNLAIGSAHDNAMDVPVVRRRAKAALGGAVRRRLTADQVRELRARARAGERQFKLAEVFGVLRSTVCEIISGRLYPEDSNVEQAQEST